MNYAIILAGGIGSRFWPLSRRAEPKQFLNLCSDKPMIEETIQRLNGLIRKENVYIATNRLYSRKVRKCVKSLGIPCKNILFEPQAKNTFAPVAVLCERINRADPEAVIALLPCDHLIKNSARFLSALKKALKVARQGYIVTLGVVPKRPETGYGYIKIGSMVPACLAGRRGWSMVYGVQKFIEKPDLPSAKKLIQDKRYYWNSGIFIFRADTMLEEIKKFMPSAWRLITRMKKASPIKLWHKLPSVSVDYAIMEKSRKLALLPADYGWLDLGSWQAVEEVSRKDKEGNVLKGNCIALDTSNSFIWSDKRLVAALGLDNIIVVDTKDALLVCSKDKAQEVKKVVRLLKGRKGRRH